MKKRQETLRFPKEDHFIIELNRGEGNDEPVKVSYNAIPSSANVKLTYLGRELPTMIETTEPKIVFKLESCSKDCFIDMTFETDKHKKKLNPSVKVKVN